jgi:hypothetical protein
MKITAQKTNRKDYFNLYSAFKIGNGKSRCFQITMGIRANSKEEALSEENKKIFIETQIKPSYERFNLRYRNNAGVIPHWHI